MSNELHAQYKCVGVDELREQYNFTILNPSHNDGQAWALWIRNGDHEWPIYRVGGVGHTMFSRHQTAGQENFVLPTDDFFGMLTTLTHEALVTFPSVYFAEGHCEQTIEETYAKAPEHEKTIATVLAEWFTKPTEEYVPEYVPLARHAARNTRMNVPYLVEHTE